MLIVYSTKLEHLTALFQQVLIRDCSLFKLFQSSLTWDEMTRHTKHAYTLTHTHIHTLPFLAPLFSLFSYLRSVGIALRNPDFFA